MDLTSRVVATELPCYLLLVEHETLSPGKFLIRYGIDRCNRGTNWDGALSSDRFTILHHRTLRSDGVASRPAAGFDRSDRYYYLE